MIIGGKDRKAFVDLRWDNLRLALLEQMHRVEVDRLLQYGALVAYAAVTGDDVAPILEAAKGRLSRFAYSALESFAGRVP